MKITSKLNTRFASTINQNDVKFFPELGNTMILFLGNFGKFQLIFLVSLTKWIIRDVIDVDINHGKFK